MTLLTDELRVYIHQEADIRELTDLDQDLIDRVRTRIRIISGQVNAGLQDQSLIDEAESLVDLLEVLVRQRTEKIMGMVLRDLREDRDACLDELLAPEKVLYFTVRECIWSCAERLGVSFEEVPSCE